MTGKQKIAAALAGGAEDIGVVIPYESILVRDHWDELTCCPWWYARSPELGQQLEWRAQVAGAVDHDWYEVPVALPASERSHLRVEERVGEVFLSDSRTGNDTKLERPRVSGWSGDRSELTKPQPPTSQSDLEKRIGVTSFKCPDATSPPSDGSADLAAEAAVGYASGRFAIWQINAPLWACFDEIWGFEPMMQALADAPELVARACRLLTDRARAQVWNAAAFGADAVFIEECLADQISPAMYRRFSLPCLQQITSEAAAAGLKSIHYFCGDPAGRLDLLINTGADALALEESKKGFKIDIAEIASSISSTVCLFGNLDSIRVLERGSDRELRLEIERQIRIARDHGSRFVVSLGSPVTPDTPISRVKLYIDLAREIGSSSYSFQ